MANTLQLFYSQALNDDFEGVRKVALKLVFEFGKLYPDERVRGEFKKVVETALEGSFPLKP